MDAHHLQIVRDQLKARGLTFDPLQEEMLDHICCDVETKMGEGISFNDALQNTLDSIPPEHFRNVQQDVLDAIHTRISLSRWFSYAGLASLYGSVCFKLLHLQFGELLLLSSFACFILSLVMATVSGIYFNRGKRGAIGILVIVVAVAMLLTGHAFRIVHFQGSDIVISSAVVVMIVSFLMNTLLMYRSPSDKGNLLTFLHEKYTPSIERFLLILLLPIAAYKLFSFSVAEYRFVGDLIFLIILFAGGLQLIALGWRAIEKVTSLRSPAVFAVVTLSCLCLSLLYLGIYIPVEVRVGLVVMYTIVSAWLALQLDEKGNVSLVSAVVVSCVFVVWAMVRLGLISDSVNRFIFNLPVALLLFSGLFLAKRNSAMRTYMIVSISGYLFEYSQLNA